MADERCPQRKDGQPHYWLHSEAYSEDGAICRVCGAIRGADQMTGQPAEVGRCGDRAPEFLIVPAEAAARCRLPHGHPGWHKGDDGSEWSPLPAVPAADTAATPAAVDTAEILEHLNGMSDAPVSFHTYLSQVRALCRALDAAQARADDLAAEVERMVDDHPKGYEAGYADGRKTAEAAEARATAAEAELQAERNDRADRDVRNLQAYYEMQQQRDAAEAQVAAVRALAEDYAIDPRDLRVRIRAALGGADD